MYLYYSPPTVEDIKQSDGRARRHARPAGAAPTDRGRPERLGHVASGYFQLSRFKFVDGGSTPPRSTSRSEQKILKVANNRGACCHVAGDIDFDTHNNLWLVTGDDTPAGGGNSGGFAPAQRHDDERDPDGRASTTPRAARSR